MEKLQCQMAIRSFLRLADVVKPEKRSQMMSGIGGKDTKPEIMVRKGLHAKGFRYLLHHRELPGKPDLVFPRYKSVILVNGCFWHGHSCHLFKWPASRTKFWKQKITGTVERDNRNIRALENEGWRILTIWECALKGKTRLPVENVIEIASQWLSSTTGNLEIKGYEDVTN